jgi:hypothetical protein
MRMTRFALVTASLVAVGCASEASTSPLDANPAADSRLAAVATAPVMLAGSSMVTMKVAVTSTLTESVTGGVCASVVEARTAASTAWVNVTSSTFACPALAAVLTPGATLTLTAAADETKIKSAAGASTTVLLRARSSLSGASATYVLQSNEVSYQVP